MRKTLIALVALVALATAGTTLAASAKGSCGCTERPASQPGELAPWHFGP
jgi:hypothetical protein